MMKSSNDIVKAIKAPEMIPGLICGTMTFVNACQGVAPKSMAASAKLSSKLLSFGIIDKMTYGIQKAMCAKSSVMNPRSILKVIKSSINPMAVTISGFIIGKSFTC